MKKYYLVVAEHRSVANTRVHHGTMYYEFDLLDLLSVKFYVMFIQFLLTYFKMRYEVMKLRIEHRKQRSQLKKALNQTHKVKIIDTEDHLSEYQDGDDLYLK